MARDYYAVLGIATTAGTREIRQAYRRLARQYSPDVNVGDEQTRALFDEISEAYRVLIDPSARAMYDRFGHVLVGRGPTASARRGDDLHVAVELSLEDAATGVKRTLDLLRFSLCAACGGPGCEECDGRGVRRRREPCAVSIPAGVDTGTQIRVEGEGHAGPHGGPRGNLIVSTRVREHPLFDRKGDNLYCEVLLTIGEAILGARIQVPSLAGAATLVVPPGTQSGQTFRLRGRGIPHLFGDGVGDLYVTTRVQIPTDLDEQTRAVVEDLERRLGPGPRPRLASAPELHA